MSHPFGWSLPPGVTRLPGEEPDPFEAQMAHRCSKCGGFLPLDPVRMEPWEDSTPCTGKVSSVDGEYFADCGRRSEHPAHKEIMDAGSYLFFVCRKCGHETKARDM